MDNKEFSSLLIPVLSHKLHFSVEVFPQIAQRLLRDLNKVLKYWNCGVPVRENQEQSVTGIFGLKGLCRVKT